MLNTLLVNLPRDMGDCVLSSSAIAAVATYAEKNGHDFACIGSKVAHGWMEEILDLRIGYRIPEETENPLMIFDFNLHEHELPRHLQDSVVFAPAKVRFVEKDEKNFGVGAIVGEKHVFNLYQDCLRNTGIIGLTEKLPLPSIKAANNKFGLENSYALIVPVCAPQRPLKKWPTENFASLAKKFAGAGITPVLIGGPSQDEKELCAMIAQEIPAARDLCGKTSLKDIASLAAACLAAVGNDTGPLHIAAAAGADSYSFFGYYNDAATWRPLSPKAHVLSYGRHVTGLTVDQVWAAVTEKAGIKLEKRVYPSAP